MIIDYYYYFCCVKKIEIVTVKLNNDDVQIWSVFSTYVANVPSVKFYVSLVQISTSTS